MTIAINPEHITAKLHPEETATVIVGPCWETSDVRCMCWVLQRDVVVQGAQAVKRSRKPKHSHTKFFCCALRCTAHVVELSNSICLGQTVLLHTGHYSIIQKKRTHGSVVSRLQLLTKAFPRNKRALLPTWVFTIRYRNSTRCADRIWIWINQNNEIGT